MSSPIKNSRRNFLKLSTLTTGGLLLGFDWFAKEVSAATLVDTTGITGIPGNVGFNSYLSISTDGVITLLSPNPELGQNIMTSFPMIVAEELDADKIFHSCFQTKSFQDE